MGRQLLEELFDPVLLSDTVNVWHLILRERAHVLVHLGKRTDRRYCRKLSTVVYIGYRYKFLEMKTYIPLQRKNIRLAQTPKAKFCVGNTNMLVSKNVQICVTPNAKSQRESVEYRLRWVPNAKFLRWLCTFLFFVSISFALGPVFLVE